MKKGVLFINVGSPLAPETKEVGEYLKEFLMDPDIISIPYLFRYFLVHKIIVPGRSAQSAEAYKKIWTNQGSPLVNNTKELSALVKKNLGDEFEVGVGMRYGLPSIKGELARQWDLGIRDITVVPLFPQFARATTESGRLEVLRVAKSLEKSGSGRFNFKFLPPFYSDEGFLKAFAEACKKKLNQTPPSFLLFSFHGLPRSARDSAIYEKQCYETAKLIGERLGIDKDSYRVSFQSRLGRAKWIAPYTEDVFKELAGKGIKTLVVACPSFVGDCLETLEEIGMRGSEIFKEAGGEKLVLVPCPNADPSWASALAKLIQAV